MQAQKERQKCLKAFQRLRVLEDSKDGYAKCITCGKIYPVSELDGGHYIGRRHTCTELEHDNVQPQCRRCNRYLAGDAVMYRIKLVEKIGVEKVERLENILKASIQGSDAREKLDFETLRTIIRKKTEKEYSELAKQYRKEYRELKKR